MGPEVIINNIANWLQNWVGRYVFRKTRLRYRFKEKLTEIVDGYAYAMADSGRICSLVSVIRGATTEDNNKNTRIQGQLRAAQILGRSYTEYKDSPNLMVLRHVSKSFDQFAKLLYETHSVFNEFFQVIDHDELIRTKLKNDSSRYPYFEKIYNKTIIDFEDLCKEAKKALGCEFREYQFTPLPRL